MVRTFYRVCNPTTQQGLWYNFDGTFSGLIHDKFTFCANTELLMDFDSELVGWLSAVEELDHLWAWFTEEDILELQKYGWYIYEYRVTDYKFYEKFQHWVICQESSQIANRIEL